MNFKFCKLVRWTILIQMCSVKAVVVPARMIQNRVKTNSLNGNAASFGKLNLFTDIAKPFGTRFVLDARFGNHYWAFIPFKVFAHNQIKRAIILMPAQNFFAASMSPLIVEIIIQADNIEVFLASAKFGFTLSTQHIQRVKLRQPVFFRRLLLRIVRR